MDYQETVNQLDSETVAKLKTAVELGRWENGDKLTTEQVAHAMQAVMLWTAKNEHISADEPFKVNDKGEFKIGKGAKLKDTPLEFKSVEGANLIFSTKD